MGNAVQMLTPEQFRLVFGRISESAAVGGDPVLDWYVKDGIRALGGLEWQDALAAEMGLERPDDEDPEYHDKIDRYISALNDCDSDEFKAAACRVLRNTIGESNFILAGQGSCKVTFVDKAGHALKIGRGGGDTASEIAIRLKFPDLECFPKMLAYAEDGTSYMCECAKRPTPEDFERLFGISDAGKTLRACNDGSGRFQKLFAKTRQLKYKALADPEKFLDQRELIDIDREDNWGLTVRDEQEVLVVVDYDL